MLYGITPYYLPAGTGDFPNLYPCHAPFSSACDLIMVFDKPQLCAKFEVASFSRYRNIIGKPDNCGELL